MEFKKNDEKLSFIEQQFAEKPCINVIGKKRFEERVSKVFTILWSKLARSFGPGGAGTFISIYPSYYNTKDGFTIMKNVAFDKKLDQVICDMVMDICSRLNFTVGDGTTSAVIATKSTYDAYIYNKEFFESNNILPRNILKRLEYFKNEILKKIDEEAIPIRSNNPDELEENIRKVVHISSNGNEEITDMISSLYKELMYPAISVTLSKDGTMKSSIIDGYKINISLSDKLYINNDNNTMILNDVDVIMFDHKVMKETYEKLLKPLSDVCKQRGRHLICIAPFYDEMALSGVIKKDLNAEYLKNKDINLVLTVCSKLTGNDKVKLEDLAMLLNTSVITSPIENEMIEKYNRTEDIYSIFDIDGRNINDIKVAEVVEEGRLHLITASSDKKNKLLSDCYEELFRVGFCNNINLGLSESNFSGFHYDQDIYNKFVSVAKEELEEVQKKCEKIGTFSLELNRKQERVYSLGLKTGLIEVGSTSEISQGYLKDTVDDAVKAAASAYNNGVINGCNVSLMTIMMNMIYESYNDESTLDNNLLKLLLSGFGDVYKTVLANVIENIVVFDMNKLIINDDTNVAEHIKNNIVTALNSIYELSDNTIEIIGNWCDSEYNFVKSVNDSLILDNFKMEIFNGLTLYDVILDISAHHNKVFDVTTGEFSSNIINSAETDKEILKAVIDLISLLMTGNQLVLR